MHSKLIFSLSRILKLYIIFLYSFYFPIFIIHLLNIYNVHYTIHLLSSTVYFVSSVIFDFQKQHVSK